MGASMSIFLGFFDIVQHCRLDYEINRPISLAEKDLGTAPDCRRGPASEAHNRQGPGGTAKPSGAWQYPRFLDLECDSRAVERANEQAQVNRPSELYSGTLRGRSRALHEWPQSEKPRQRQSLALRPVYTAPKAPKLHAP